MAYIKTIISLFIYFISYNFLYADDYLRSEIVNFDGSNNSQTIIDKGGYGSSSGSGLGLLDSIIKFFKDSIFGLLYIVIVATFIYIGAKLVMARGKPDQFKKVWTQIMHIVIGIFLITGAWAIVKIVSGLSF